MKFLKTFLFTISFCFIFGSIMSLCGYCEAAPVLTPDSSSLEVIQGGGMPYYYGMQGYGEMFFMSDEFNSNLNNFGIAVEDWLEQNTGYNSDQLIVNAGNEYINKIDEAGFGQGNPSGGISPSTAQWLVNRFSNGLNNGVALGVLGYSLIKQAVPQFGRDCYQYFIGKIDSANNTLSDVCSNFVTKITQEGVSNYLQATSDLIQDNTISDLSSGVPFKSKNLVLKFKLSVYDATLNVNFSDDVIFYSYDTALGSTYANNTLCCLIPSDKYRSISVNGVCVFGNNTAVISRFVPNSYNTLTINGVSYNACRVEFEGTNYIIPGALDYNFGNINDASLLVSSGGSVKVCYHYSDSSVSALNNILNQLIGKWVDNQSLNQIQTIIKEVPIIVENQNNVAVPVADIDPFQLQELQSLVDQIILYSSYYDELDLPEPEPEPEPEPDPEPSPNNQGTEVPEDFPTTIFSPINDSVGSVFDFVSIFEPLFYIFSFSTGLLGLWLVVPFVILFLILFRLLK